MAKNKLIPKIRKPGVAIFGCCLHVFPTPKMADADFILPHALFAYKFRLFVFLSSQNFHKNAKIQLILIEKLRFVNFTMEHTQVNTKGGKIQITLSYLLFIGIFKYFFIF